MPVPGPDLTGVQVLARFTRELSGGTAAGPTEQALRVLEPAARLELLLEEARRVRIVPPQTDLARFRRLVGVFEANTRALGRYEPPRLDAPLLVFEACQRREPFGRNAPGDWSAYGARMHRERLDGDHYSIVRGEAARRVAQHVCAYLESSTAGELYSAAGPRAPDPSA